MTQLQNISRERLAQFGRTLVDTYVLTTVEDVLWFFEEPERYQSEFEAWLVCGKPKENEGDVNWQLFLAKLNELSVLAVYR